jgi:hypothetical protein
MQLFEAGMIFSGKENIDLAGNSCYICLLTCCDRK